MASPILQFKRGNFANLPGLQAGEPALTVDKFDLFVGIDSTTGANKLIGSHRYWTRETTTAGSGVNLVEGSNNGSNHITLKAPASITSNQTYTFPAAAVNNGQSALVREAYPKKEQDFIDNEVNTLCAMANEWVTNHEEKAYPKLAWDFARKNRFLGMIIPEKFGGLEFSAYAQSEILAKISSRSSVLSAMIMVPNSLGPGELLIHYGTDEQRKKYLIRS